MCNEQQQQQSAKHITSGLFSLSQCAIKLLYFTLYAQLSFAFALNLTSIHMESIVCPYDHSAMKALDGIESRWTGREQLPPFVHLLKIILHNMWPITYISSHLNVNRIWIECEYHDQGLRRIEESPKVDISGELSLIVTNKTLSSGILLQ